MKGSERHKLKQDRFVRALYEVAEWAKAHQKELGLAVLALVIVGGAVAWWATRAQAAEESARELLAEMRQKAQGLAHRETEEQGKIVDAIIATADRMAAEYGDTDSAGPAMLTAAHALAETGNHEKAAAYYRKALPLLAGAPDLELTARRGLAESLEATGDVESAATEYRTVLETAAAEMAAQAAWDLGRCHELMEKETEAKAYYRQAVEKGAGGMWARLAENRLGVMENPPEEAPTPEEETAESPFDLRLPAGPAPSDEEEAELPGDDAGEPAPDEPAGNTNGSEEQQPPPDPEEPEADRDAEEPEGPEAPLSD